MLTVGERQSREALASFSRDDDIMTAGEGKPETERSSFHKCKFYLWCNLYICFKKGLLHCSYAYYLLSSQICILHSEVLRLG